MEAGASSSATLPYLTAGGLIVGRCRQFVSYLGGWGVVFRSNLYINFFRKSEIGSLLQLDKGIVCKDKLDFFVLSI